MLRIDMHMHPWSRSGRALILWPVRCLSETDRCMRVWRCDVSADSSHLPALPRAERSPSLTGRLFIDQRLCISKVGGLVVGWSGWSAKQHQDCSILVCVKRDVASVANEATPLWNKQPSVLLTQCIMWRFLRKFSGPSTRDLCDFLF